MNIASFLFIAVKQLLQFIEGRTAVVHAVDRHDRPQSAAPHAVNDAQREFMLFVGLARLDIEHIGHLIE